MSDPQAEWLGARQVLRGELVDVAHPWAVLSQIAARLIADMDKLAKGLGLAVPRRAIKWDVITVSAEDVIYGQAASSDAWLRAEVLAR